MQPVQFFGIFFLLLLFGSVLICGWFTITRGQIIENEDGTKEKVGKIFKGWYFFWFREKENKRRIYYSDSYLFSIKENLQKLGAKDLKLNFVNSLTAPKSFIRDSVFYAMRLGVKFEFKTDETDPDNSAIVFVYKEEPDYVFPAWLRDMMAGCITCHGSLYGSIVFWTFYKLSDNGIIDNAWAEQTQPMIILVWLSYMVMLSFVNTALWKKLG